MLLEQTIGIIDLLERDEIRPVGQNRGVEREHDVDGAVLLTRTEGLL